MIYNFLKTVLFLMVGVGIISPISFAGSKLPCRLRNSNYCKDPKYFERDKRDGCGGPKTNCRQKFCAANCFGPEAPEKNAKPGSIYSLCQANCDPEFINVSPQDKRLFISRFFDLTVQRRRETGDYVRSIQGPLLDKCRNRCDYECQATEVVVGQDRQARLVCADSISSCKTKEIPNGDAATWADCAKDCFFLSDIKEHADYCVTKGREERQDKRPKPAPRPKRNGVTFYQTGEVSFSRGP